MGMTMIEKILARAAGHDHVDVGEFVVCEVDMTVLIDLQFATLWASPTRIADARPPRGDHGPRRAGALDRRTPTAASALAPSSSSTASSGSSMSGATASATR